MREISDPTYLALSADRILYTFGKTAAGVSVYAIRDQVVLNSLPCASGGPCKGRTLTMPFSTKTGMKS